MFNPSGLPTARGFSYGVLAAEGRSLHIAGMTGQKVDLSFDDSLTDQFQVACQGVADVIADAGGVVTDLVSMTIYTTDVDDYLNQLTPIGVVYRQVFGRHYPAMALFGVDRLFDVRAKVELSCVAVVPVQVDL